MTETEIRRSVMSRENVVEVETDWYTPSGNRRSAPMYVARIANDYLGKVKSKTTWELKAKAEECLSKWADQEIRKRVVEAKNDLKERAKAETVRLEGEARAMLEELATLLHHTLSVDDKIDWEAERDTRMHPSFSYPNPPSAPAPSELVLPKKPGWTWLLKGRLRKWELACADAQQTHLRASEAAQREWQQALEDHHKGRNQAERQHETERRQLVADQEHFNAALVAFREQFERGDASAIKEYCSRVLERSDYPEPIRLKHSMDFDSEEGYVLVNLELPAEDGVPCIAGYKFVAKDNTSKPVPLKKREAKELYNSVLNQIVVRTIHEILEGCYINAVRGAVVTGWVTTLDPGTGRDERRQVRCVVADRATFESFDLSRVDPAACIERLGEGVGHMSGEGR